MKKILNKPIKIEINTNILVAVIILLIIAIGILLKQQAELQNLKKRNTRLILEQMQMNNKIEYLEQKLLDETETIENRLYNLESSVY
jgi:hypothetical protein